jgi:4'-phosphopantetheinyl transferase
VTSAVTVWGRQLTGTAEPGEWELLTTAERARAAAIGDPRARSRYVCTRAMLRQLLAERVGSDACDVMLETTPHGALRVGGHPTIHVSVSHTRDLALVALADGPVGVDVERCDRRVPPGPHRWLTLGERRQLDALDADERQTALIRLWTAKEAVGKALGLGWAAGRQAIDVDGSTATVGDPAELAVALRLVELDAGPEHIAALALTSAGPAATAVRSFDPVGDVASGLR